MRGYQWLSSIIDNEQIEDALHRGGGASACDLHFHRVVECLGHMIAYAAGGHRTKKPLAGRREAIPIGDQLFESRFTTPFSWARTGCGACLDANRQLAEGGSARRYGVRFQSLSWSKGVAMPTAISARAFSANRSNLSQSSAKRASHLASLSVSINCARVSTMP